MVMEIDQAGHHSPVFGIEHPQSIATAVTERFGPTAIAVDHNDLVPPNSHCGSKRFSTVPGHWQYRTILDQQIHLLQVLLREDTKNRQTMLSSGASAYSFFRHRLLF